MTSPRDDAPDGLTVRVVGIVQGRELDGTARLTRDGSLLRFTWPADVGGHPMLRLAVDTLDGLAVGNTSLTLYLQDDDVLELRGDDALRPFALALADHCCMLPEFTRGLRHLGAVRLAPALQTAHDRFFGPFLAARRAVHDVSDPARQVTLMDGVALAAALEQALADIAASHAAGDAADQRALEAALEDEVHPLFAACQRMAMAGDQLRGAGDDTRLADWRRWVAEVQAAYAAADTAWEGVEEVLGG